MQNVNGPDFVMRLFIISGRKQTENGIGLVFCRNYYAPNLFSM